MSKKALLVGGTGAIGVYLQAELLLRGFIVDVTTRSSRRSTNSKLRYIKGDAHEVVFLNTVLDTGKYDVIVDFMVYSTTEFNTRAEGILSRCKHYIFLSSYRVYADASIITEETPRLIDSSTDKEFLGSDDYSLVKARQEYILSKSIYKNWTIVRPSITYSKERFQLGTLEADEFVWRALKGLPVILPGAMLDRVTTMTWAGDVARLIAGLSLNKRAFGEDFNLATNEHHTWAEVADIYNRIVGLQVKSVEVSDYIEALGGDFNKYQIFYDRMYNRIVDSSKVLIVTGETKEGFTSLEDGLAKELREFISKPRFGTIDYARQAHIDRLTKTRVDLSEATSEQQAMYLAINPRHTVIKVRPKRGARERATAIYRRVKHLVRFRTRLRGIAKAIVYFTVLTNAPCSYALQPTYTIFTSY